MKKLKFLLIMCCVLMFNQIGFASEKIGVVDIQEIVCNSCSVKALKQEHSRQLESLNSIVTEAQSAISKETDPQKIVMLQDKYNAEFNRKKNMIDNQYETKLTEIENNLKKDIILSAKKHDYDYVFAKSVVFYGGDDITELVKQEVR